LFDLSAIVPNINQLISVKKSKIIENQFILGKKLYRFETMKPKLILGVAEPLIMNSGLPVKNPESQF
jgi:hypothetical protein